MDPNSLPIAPLTPEQWVILAIQVISYVIAAATLIVKATPTLKDNNFLLPIVKFIAKFLALNTNTPEERPK